MKGNIFIEFEGVLGHTLACPELLGKAEQGREFFGDAFFVM